MYNFKIKQGWQIYIEVLNIYFYVFYNHNSNESINATLINFHKIMLTLTMEYLGFYFKIIYFYFLRL